MTPRAERIGMTADGPCLQGIACRACGARSFPPAKWCRSCHSDDIEVIALARRGRVEAVAAYDGTAFGEVRLADGLMVAGRLDPANKVKVGTPVRFDPDDDIVRFSIDD
jgi:uncharacterized OB-fold protein